MTSDIDKNEKYFESDSFVVSLNKARSVRDLSELGLEYNYEGEFFFCATCFESMESDSENNRLSTAGHSELQAGIFKYEKVLGLEFIQIYNLYKYMFEHYLDPP